MRIAAKAFASILSFTVIITRFPSSSSSALSVEEKKSYHFTLFEKVHLYLLAIKCLAQNAGRRMRDGISVRERVVYGLNTFIIYITNFDANTFSLLSHCARRRRKLNLIEWPTPCSSRQPRRPRRRREQKELTFFMAI